MNDMQRKYREKNKRRMEIYRDVERKVNQLWWYPKDCPICWKETTVVWHHPDYNKPFEIVFCCNMCHSKIHSDIIECPKPIDLLLEKNKNERITNCTNLWEISLR
jgi:hypothetical protein